MLEFGDMADNLDAIHIGHHEVAENKAYTGAGLLDVLDRFLSAGGIDDGLNPGALEDTAGHCPDKGFIVDDKDAKPPVNFGIHGKISLEQLRNISTAGTQ